MDIVKCSSPEAGEEDGMRTSMEGWGPVWKDEDQYGRMGWGTSMEGCDGDQYRRMGWGPIWKDGDQYGRMGWGPVWKDGLGTGRMG